MSDFESTMGEELDAWQKRLHGFRDTAQETDGPLGALFQQIALAHQQFSDAAELHGTTMGEAARLIGVVEAAMAAVEWLRSNDTGSVVALPLGEWIAEIADQTGSGHVLGDDSEVA